MRRDLRRTRDGVTPAVQTDGSSEPVRIVVPKNGDSGFYKVIRNQ